jgi:hypothetical protein
MVTGELKDLQVRLITKEETNLWGQYMEKYHYLGYRFIPGESLRYVALLDGIWVAIIGWGSPALKCTVRDRYIGWDNDTKYKRLSFVANNVRFLIFPWVHIKNLASRILAVNLKMLCADYTRIHGHPVYLAETFVDESLYKGTCYKAANWIYLGHTKGFSKKGKHYYNNNRPKGVYVYPLSKAGKVILTTPFLPAGRHTMEDRTILSLENLPVEAIDDPRKPRGIRHNLAVVLTLSVCAVLCWARSYLGIWEWAKKLPKDVIKRFGCRRNISPSEPTFRRILQAIDADEFDRTIGSWLVKNAAGYAVAIDGKTVRGSDDDGIRFHLPSAVVHKEGVVLNQKKVDAKTNEIRLVKPLLKDIPLEDAIITGDALTYPEGTGRLHRKGETCRLSFYRQEKSGISHERH